MTTYLPAYRLTLYAPRSIDATEATVLTPTAGAPHADAFQISTLPTLAGYKPYLADVPTGRTGRIDVLNKRTDVGQLTFKLLDHILAAGNPSQRWVTAFSGDAFGRSRWLGLKAVCDESLDGGLTWNASGLPYWTGRVQNLKASGKLQFDLSVNDMSEDLKALVGVGLPHVNVQTYAGVLSLLPLGPQVTYGLLAPRRPFTAVASTPAFGLGMLVTLDADARSSAWNTATEELLAGTIAPLFYNTDWHIVPNANGPLRVQVKHTSGANSGSTGIYKIGYITTGPRPGGTSYVGSLEIELLDDASAPGYLALPAAGVTVQVLATWRDAQVSETQPLLINDQHPIQHLKDIANGYYGWLYKPGETRPAGKNIGDAKRSVAVNAAAVATLLADTSFPNARLWLTAVEPGGDVIEKYLGQGYQLGYYFDGAGQLTPVDLRVPTVTPSLALTDADVVADASFDWALERDNSVQRVNAKYYYDYQVPLTDEGYLGTGDAVPSVAKAFLYPIESLLEVLEVGSADLGDQALDIDAKGYRYMAGEVAANVPRVDYEKAQLAASARCLTYPFGSGGKTGTLTLRRTANALAVQPGTLLLLTISWLPDPWTNQRGGTRVVRCTELTKNGATLTGRFLDYGAGNVAAVPALGAPAQVAGNTSHGAQVSVTSNAQGDDVDLQVAVTIAGSVPGATDPAWHAFSVYNPIHNVSAPPWNVTAIAAGLSAGGRIWFRARSLPGPYNKLQQASAWVTSTSVDLVGLTAPSALGTSAIGSTVFTCSFTVGSASAATEVLLSQPNGQPYKIIATLLPGTNTYVVTGLDPSTTVGLQIRHTDGAGGYSSVVSTTVAMLGAGSDVALPALTGFALSQYTP